MDTKTQENVQGCRSGSANETNPVKKFMSAPTQTRGMAIKAFCSQCMGCNEERIEPGFAKMVRECTAPRCALYKFRPFQAKD